MNDKQNTNLVFILYKSNIVHLIYCMIHIVFMLIANYKKIF